MFIGIRFGWLLVLAPFILVAGIVYYALLGALALLAVLLVLVARGIVWLWG